MAMIVATIREALLYIAHLMVAIGGGSGAGTTSTSTTAAKSRSIHGWCRYSCICCWLIWWIKIGRRVCGGWLETVLRRQISLVRIIMACCWNVSIPILMMIMMRLMWMMHSIPTDMLIMSIQVIIAIVITYFHHPTAKFMAMLLRMMMISHAMIITITIFHYLARLMIRISRGNTNWCVCLCAGKHQLIQLLV